MQTTLTVEAVYASLFENVNGYGISILDKCTHTECNTSDFTYGEVTPEAMRQILELFPEQGGVFCDLGSGTGKAVILAAMMGNFSQSIGVELLPGLHQAALEVASRYTAVHKPEFDATNPCELIYRNENILDTDLSNTDMILGHCITCFSDEMMNAFTQKCLQTQPGTIIISISRQLVGDKFELVRTTSCPMGWGNATLYASLRK